MDEEDDEPERFEALCVALRRNDPETTEIRVVGFGHRLGEALQGNRYVSSMSLNLSLREANEEDTEDLALMLRYIRESESMRKVELWGALPVRLGRLLLLAIAESHCIEDFSFYSIAAFPEEIAQLMRTTQSLKTLSIRLGSEDRKLVADAFGANRTLESLELRRFSDSATVESVLRQLGSHPRLRELKLHCGDGDGISQLNGLSYFLRSTSLLEHLELCEYRFDKERMECVVEGLHSNQSITKISLWICKFDLEATDMFRSFMKTGETRSCIRELRIGGGADMFAGSSAGTLMVASMLTMPDGETQGTGSSIGSSIQVLDLSGDFAGFYRALAADASRIRLACLRRTYNAGYNDWEEICRCLPKLVYLRELTIPQVCPNASSWNFVDALRKNGSLQRVAVADENIEEAPFFNERETHLIQSICKRNEAIPILVAKLRLDSDIDDDDEARLDLLLLPMLFETAKQARRTAPNSMLIALLGAGNCIGPCQRTLA